MNDSPSVPAQSALLRLYRIASPIVGLFAYARARKRLLADGIPRGRLQERLGRATLARPPGPLVWFHAASIGESLSILPLVEELAGETAILVTSGTGTSAKLLAKRLPPGAVHQFAPLDTPGAARRFLKYWRPYVGVFVESEIWPNLIETAWRRSIPLMLINARMSDRTLSRWAERPHTAAAILSRFLKIVTQDKRTLDGLTRVVPGPERRLSLGGNMKAAAAPLPVDPESLAQWRATLGDRPCWIASSTHEGEDGPVLAAHATIRETHPDAFLILVPRHPNRGAGIAETARAQGFETARRTGNEPVTHDTAVLVADTIGDLGLWYRLSPVVFLAGSFGEAGGHNPWEPIALGAALLHGPKVPNAANDYQDLASAGAAWEVADGAALAKAVNVLLSDPDILAAQQKASHAALKGADGLVQSIANEIRHHLKAGALAR